MNIEKKLQIYLITYNRLEHLKRTLNQIFSKDSPIKNFDITILDNASTDGTSEYIEEYCQNFTNIKHIRHRINIGGNANICRAFELGANCGKEYVWVLCDDDYYDWTKWNEVEKAIDDKVDIICVSNYFFPNKEMFDNKIYQIPQLTFVPAGIYRAELINNDVLLNMYENIFTMFSQSCISIYAINKNKRIKVIDKQIVDNGLHHNVYVNIEELSYSRGADKENFLSERMIHRNWILGFCNIVSLLKNKKIRQQTIEVSVIYKDIYGSWNNFYDNIIHSYFYKNKFNYFCEIYKCLSFSKKLKLLFAIFNPVRCIKIILKSVLMVEELECGKDYRIIKVLWFKIKRKR